MPWGSFRISGGNLPLWTVIVDSYLVAESTTASLSSNDNMARGAYTPVPTDVDGDGFDAVGTLDDNETRRAQMPLKVGELEEVIVPGEDQ